MLVDTIGAELGLNSPETFVATFLSQISTNSHGLFSEAIKSLSGASGMYWRDIRDAPEDEYGDLLSICTEQIIECFSAEFVKSSYEIAEEVTHE
jgi:hypothetical protein